MGGLSVMGWLGLVDGWFGVVMFGRWVVWVALGWFWVVLLAGLRWYLGLVWRKVRGKVGIGLVWGISGWFG